MSYIGSSFGVVGEAIQVIFTSPLILYSLYIFVLFFGLYSLVRRGLNQIQHLEGKPATVVAVGFSIISVGSIAYGKSPQELLSLFHGFLGFILALAIAIGVIVGAIVLEKKTEKTSLKVVIVSIGVVIGINLLLNPLVAVFSQEGFAGIIHSILAPIRDTAFVVGFVAMIMYLFSLLSSSNQSLFSFKPKTKEAKNKVELKKLLQDLGSEMETAEEKFQKLDNYLNQMNKSLKDFTNQKNS